MPWPAWTSWWRPTLFGSRSECAAFLIGAGIDSQKELFERLGAHTEEIRKLKEQLRQVALDALKPGLAALRSDCPLFAID